ncbi:MAG: 4Fe-4S binding protein, partial [Candidatus Izimaplasma sp.]|nr:4Fe-4S binding protein [Candidatus Izimaplasma bacterium]
MLNTNGVADKSLVLSKFPDKEYLLKPKAITECYEAIPCNPCATSCPFDAIHIGEDINTPPTVDFDKCTGCGICVYNCPGLAIFTVQALDTENARFKIPYELCPLPIKGETWDGINRAGEVITKVLIEKVSLSEKQDKTALIQVLVP